MRAFWVATILLVTACGAGSGMSLQGTYSCAAGLDPDAGADVPDVCLEVTGGTAQDLANNQSNCSASGGTFAFAPCPRAGALGGCRETIPTVGSITDWSYEDGVTTVEEVRMQCEHEASLGFPVTFVAP
jgi:hypothetical protein